MLQPKTFCIVRDTSVARNKKKKKKPEKESFVRKKPKAWLMDEDRWGVRDASYTTSRPCLPTPYPSTLAASLHLITSPVRLNILRHVRRSSTKRRTPGASLNLLRASKNLFSTLCSRRSVRRKNGEVFSFEARLAKMKSDIVRQFVHRRKTREPARKRCINCESCRRNGRNHPREWRVGGLNAVKIELAFSFPPPYVFVQVFR